MFDYRKGSNIGIIVKIIKDISKTQSEERVLMRIYKCLSLKLEMVGRMSKGRENSRYGTVNQALWKTLTAHTILRKAPLPSSPRI